MRFWCERKVGKTNSLLLYGRLASGQDIN
ncbi:hypothetical protein LINGRAHAP2_LOCUS14904 [Linum grandiflorum]